MTDYRSRSLPDYSTGTVSGSSGSTTLNGAGTNWLGTDANGLQFNNIFGGDFLILPGINWPIPVRSITSATQLELQIPLPSAISGGSSYRAVRLVSSPIGIVQNALEILENRASQLQTNDESRLALRNVTGGKRLSIYDGVSTTPIDLLAISGNDLFIAQVAPTAQNTTATLAAAAIAGGLITSAPAANITLTLPTGANLDAGFPNLPADFAFDFSVINTSGSFTSTISASGATGTTLLGAGVVAAGASGQFRARKTATATWVIYRIA